MEAEKDATTVNRGVSLTKSPAAYLAPAFGRLREKSPIRACTRVCLRRPTDSSVSNCRRAYLRRSAFFASGGRVVARPRGWGEGEVNVALFSLGEISIIVVEFLLWGLVTAVG